MKTKCILVRHGKSAANDLGIAQGVGLSVPLTDEGREQAEHIAKKLKDVRLDRIYSSAAIRAVDTASIIRQFHLSVPYEELSQLVERSKGIAEGMKKDEFEITYREIAESWKNELDARPPEGESFEDVHYRVMPVLERHVRESPGLTLLYVIHGNVIRVIIGSILHAPFRYMPRIRQDYCAYNVVSFDHERERWEVEQVNHVFHA
jgi:phosphoserine phosphatase